jgi:transposase InsO family protein
VGFLEQGQTVTSSVPFIDVVELVDSMSKIKDAVTINDERFFISLTDQSGNMNSWLVDSGAAITVADPSVIPQDTVVEPLPNSFEARSASNHKLEVLGRALLQGKVQGKTVNFSAIVVEGLRTKAILGMDFIRQHGVVIDGGAGRISVAGVQAPTVAAVASREPKVTNCIALRPVETIQVFPMTGVVVPMTTRKPLEEGTVGICSDQAGCVTEAIQKVQDGRILINLHNPTQELWVFKKGEVAAFFQPMAKQAVEEILTVDEVVSQMRRTDAHRGNTAEKLRYLRENLRCGGPPQVQERLWRLIVQYQHVFSGDKFDLGRTDEVKHKIHLTNPHPVHKKQFRIPWEHQQLVKDHIEALLKARCIRTSRSPFNAPIFCVQKPHGGMRVVLDYRALNDQTFDDKYSIREVQDCIDEIGRKKSKVFSALDLTSGFWQMELDEESKPYTAFSFPGVGRFEWETAPMGLKGSPASFARLMDHVMSGLKDVLTYIDDVLVHTESFDTHLAALEQAFKRLERFNLKLNITKCMFAAQEVPYLGFHLTATGIKPSMDKVAAVRDLPSPNSPRKVREFLGMANYFRHFIDNFARVAAHLSPLTGSNSPWKGGELPERAEQAFQYLKAKLCEEPILVYPRADRPFALSVDAATGDGDRQKGGLGAMLTQLDDEGRERVVAYASCALKDHEKNYSPYLLELAACSWAIEHFSVYLRGRQFVLRTDHKPVEMVSRLHQKTLNRLQQQMSEYSFVVQHKPGVENAVPDALSRSVESISFQLGEMRELQERDELVRAVKDFMLTLRKPQTPEEAEVARLARSCVLQEGIVRYRLERKDFETRFPILAPDLIKREVIRTAHMSRFGGHGGQARTFNRIAQVYWWPSMSSDINKFVAACPTCQAAKDPAGGTKVPLRPLEIPDRPNVRIHCDLFGELKKPSQNGNKWVLVMTDAFTKYVELVALPNKSATTVAKAILERWICRFSCPEVVVTDQGKEFANTLLSELLRLMQVEYRVTSAIHPQTNSSAESFNREIIRYMKTALQGETLYWEELLPMLAISYNTQVHRSTLTTPFFLTFLHDPNLPNFDMRASRPDFGESWPMEAYARLRKAYTLARNRMQSQAEDMKRRYDTKASARPFEVGERVLLHFPRATITQGNAKLAPQWVGGYYIHQAVGPDTYWVRQIGSQAQGTVVHASRMKRVVMQEANNNIVLQPQPGLTRPALAHLRGRPETQQRATAPAQPPLDEDEFPSLVSTRSRTRQREQGHGQAQSQTQVQEQERQEEKVTEQDSRAEQAESEEEQAAQAIWQILRASRRRTQRQGAPAAQAPAPAAQAPVAVAAAQATTPPVQPQPTKEPPRSRSADRGRRFAKKKERWISGFAGFSAAGMRAQQRRSESLGRLIDSMEAETEESFGVRLVETPERSSSAARAAERRRQPMESTPARPSSLTRAETRREQSEIESSSSSEYSSAESFAEVPAGQAKPAEAEPAGAQQPGIMQAAGALLGAWWPGQAAEQQKAAAEPARQAPTASDHSQRRQSRQEPARQTQTVQQAREQRLGEIRQMQELARQMDEREARTRSTRRSTRAGGPPSPVTGPIDKNLQWGMKE